MERRERLRKLIASQDAELAEGTVVGQLEITQVAAVQVSTHTHTHSQVKETHNPFSQHTSV